MHLSVFANDIFKGVLLGQCSFQFADITQISEGHDTPDGFFIAVFQKGCRGADGDPFFVCTNNMDRPVYDRETGVHGFAENTIPFANIASEDFKARTSDGLIYGDSGNFFRCTIKVSDTPVQI